MADISVVVVFFFLILSKVGKPIGGLQYGYDLMIRVCLHEHVNRCYI